MVLFLLGLLWRVVAIYIFVQATNELVVWHYRQYVDLCELTQEAEHKWEGRLSYIVFSSPRVLAYLLILIGISYSLGTMIQGA